MGFTPVYNTGMGFTTAATILTTAASVAGKAMEASAERKQAREYNAAAEERRRLADNQAAIVTRTALEDRMLQNGLPGYKEYAARTKYRVLPGIW